MRSLNLPPVVCVGCGSRVEDFGEVGPYAHCGSDNCHSTAYSMLEEDQRAGFQLPYDDDEPVILNFPSRHDRAA